MPPFVPVNTLAHELGQPPRRAEMKIRGLADRHGDKRIRSNDTVLNDIPRHSKRRRLEDSESEETDISEDELAQPPPNYRQTLEYVQETKSSKLRHTPPARFSRRLSDEHVREYAEVESMMSSSNYARRAREPKLTKSSSGVSRTSPSSGPPILHTRSFGISNKQQSASRPKNKFVYGSRHTPKYSHYASQSLSSDEIARPASYRNSASPPPLLVIDHDAEVEEAMGPGQYESVGRGSPSVRRPAGQSQSKGHSHRGGGGGGGGGGGEGSGRVIDLSQLQKPKRHGLRQRPRQSQSSFKLDYFAIGDFDVEGGALAIVYHNDTRTLELMHEGAKQDEHSLSLERILEVLYSEEDKYQMSLAVNPKMRLGTSLTASNADGRIFLEFHSRSDFTGLRDILRVEIPEKMKLRRAEDMDRIIDRRKLSQPQRRARYERQYNAPGSQANGISYNPNDLGVFEKRAEGPAEEDKTTGDIIESTPTQIPKQTKQWKRPLEYPRTGRKRVTVHWDDLERLNAEQWLNDSLIQLYLRRIEMDLEDRDPQAAKKVYWFNTYFYDTLTRNSKSKSKINFDAVKRWTRTVDLFSYDYIIVPINDNQLHWYVAVICNLPSLFQQQAPATQGTAQSPVTLLDGTSNQKGRGGLKILSNSSQQTLQRSTGNEQGSAESSSATGLGPTGLKSSTSGASEQIQGPQQAPGQQLLSELAAAKGSTTSTPTHTKGSSPTSKGSASAGKAKGGRLQKYDPLEPAIIILDSFGGAHSDKVRSLKTYLVQEAADKKSGLVLDESKLKGVTAKGIPYQNNSWDCGLFLLAYMEKFGDDPESFITALLQKTFDADRDWTLLKSGAMRRALRNEIHRLHAEQEVERKNSQPAPKSPSGQKSTLQQQLEKAILDGSTQGESGCSKTAIVQVPTTCKLPISPLKELSLALQKDLPLEESKPKEDQAMLIVDPKDEGLEAMASQEMAPTTSLSATHPNLAPHPDTIEDTSSNRKVEETKLADTSPVIENALSAFAATHNSPPKDFVVEDSQSEDYIPLPAEVNDESVTVINRCSPEMAHSDALAQPDAEMLFKPEEVVAIEKQPEAAENKFVLVREEREIIALDD